MCFMGGKENRHDYLHDQRVVHGKNFELPLGFKDISTARHILFSDVVLF